MIYHRPVEKVIFVTFLLISAYLSGSGCLANYEMNDLNDIFFVCIENRGFFFSFSSAKNPETLKLNLLMENMGNITYRALVIKQRVSKTNKICIDFLNSAIMKSKRHNKTYLNNYQKILWEPEST